MSKEREPIVFTNTVDRQYMQDKQRKRKQARKESQIAWLLRLIFVVLLSAYLLSDYSKLKQISVFGNGAMSKKSIVSLSGLSLDTRFYGFVPWWVSKQLNDHPLIAEASVKRQNHQVVRIDVVEKPIVGYGYTDTLVWLLGDGSLVPVDEGSRDYLVSVPYIEGFTNQMELLPKLAQYLQNVDELTRSLISEIMLIPLDYDKEQLKLLMIDQNTIYVSMMHLGNINGYHRLVNAIHETGVCIFFDGMEGRAYTSQCLD